MNNILSARWAVTRVLTVTAVVVLSVCARGRAQTPPAPAVNVKAVSSKELKQALAAHKGKAVMINLWATWCGPCVDEFPDLVKLAQNYADRGLVVLGVSVDDPEDLEKVAAFARTQKAKFPIYVRKSGSLSGFTSVVNRTWEGSVPTTYILGRNGKPAGKPAVGLRTYSQFAALVEPLLK